MSHDPDDRRLRNWLQESSPRDRAERREDMALMAALTTGNDTKDAEAAELAAMREWLQGRVPPDELVRLLLPPGTRRATREDWKKARLWAQDWNDVGVKAAQVEEWLRAGLEPWRAALARELILEGVTPEMLTRVLRHPETGEQVTVLTLLGTWRLHWTTLCEALDAAGLERKRLPGLRWPWVA